MIRTLEKVTALSGPRARIPYPVAFVYAAVSEIWAKMTGGETLKAEQELGWKHRPLRETLADEVAWYRAQGLAAEPAAPAAAVTA